MKENVGTIRKIDGCGRVVIPAYMRKIINTDTVEINLVKNNDEVIIEIKKVI